MMRLLLIAALLGVAACHPHNRNAKSAKADTCGYASCPTPIPGKINVHLVPHTHDDVGWLKTVDQYYYGSRSNIQNAGVQYILDSVVDELLHDENKKFIYVETAFFWKWWLEQNDSTRHQVKQLVANGQLEFIGGGWVMNDEAVTHYQCTIDQFTWGFRKLNDTFGSCGHPKIGWQIDPFGHARETASLMAQLGFDGLFFARLDYQDKNQRLQDKTMELIWEGSPSLGASADIFSLGTYNNYASPPGFCFDILCRDEPFIDNKKSPDYNVDKRVDDFIAYAQNQSSHYKSNNILITMGEDFHFQDAHYHFKNLDKLIRYVNQRQESGGNVNVFYSTPSCYVKSLNDANLTWTTKQDDFFPYSSDPHAFWTGYFTSRPTLKYFERQGNNFLQICKQLASLANLGDEDVLDLDTLREAQGILQHHDAVVGTEKQHVADDYSRMLNEGFRDCGMLSNTALSKLQTLSEDAAPLSFRSCPLTNISQCALTENSEAFIVTVYNPLGQNVNHYVRVPVADASYEVSDPSGNAINNEVIEIADAIKNIPGRTAKTDRDLVFKAVDVPALGYRSYYVKKTGEAKNPRRVPVDGTKPIVIGKGKLKMTFDPTTKLLSSISNGRQTVDLTNTVEYYNGALGDNGASERRSSGAYIFRPDGDTTIPINNSPNITTHGDNIIFEVHQVYSPWVTLISRAYKDEDFGEMQWVVGPIPIDDGKGKEVINRFSSNLTTNGLFYTDSSGRETIERKRNYRATFPLELQEPVAGNYYPVVSDISINDGKSEFVVVVDRAEGGSSMQDGQLELMVHRRLLHDDAFGVGEALNETAFGEGLVATGTQSLLLGDMTDPTWPLRKRKFIQQAVLNSYIVITDASNLDYDTWTKNYRLEFSGLTANLPDGAKLLTLEPWKGNTYLLRLEHLLDVSESSEDITVNVNDLFSTFDIVNARETTLGANEWLDESSRLQWKKDTNNVPHIKKTVKDWPEVTLSPKQIRTFVCEIKPKVLY